jgi:pyruvate carboxylase
MFDRVLVINRVRVAARIICTARAPGLRTVAVYSDADHGRSSSPRSPSPQSMFPRAQSLLTSR